jgi:methyl-accepting chemotaxis protein
MKLHSFPLRVQIGSIAALAVVGLSFVAGAYFLSAARLDAADATIASATSGEMLALEIEIGLLQARRAEKDFLLRQDESLLTQHAAAVEGVVARLTKLTARQDDDEARRLGGSVGSELKVYGAAFASLVEAMRALGFDETKGALGELRAAAHEIEGKTTDLRVVNALLQTRRHEKDFLARGDKKYVDQTRAAVTAAAEALKADAAPEDVKRALVSALERYRSSFDRVVAAASAQVDAVKALSASFARLQPIVDQLRAGIEQRFKAAEVEAADAKSFAKAALLWIILATTFLVGLVAFVIARSVSQPLARMTEAMDALAKGDRETEIPARERGDEVGRMAAAVQVFKENMIRAREVAEREAEEQAMRQRRAEAMEKLSGEFDVGVRGVLDMVSSATTELQATAGSMSATAEETSRQSVAVAAASEQASTNVQTVASAAEELSSSIAEISRQVQQSAQVAGKAAEDAARTNGTVQTLAEAAQKIGDVVDLINDIASQTNLLALNATIEAARAGEAGKGFAVVASEVKSLANQTAKATEEIGAQISAMQSVTGEAVSAINAIGTTIGEINQIATAIASAVEEQGAATQEIARNVQQAAAGTQEVSSNIAGVQQAATDTGAASQQVLGASGELAQQAEMLRGHVEKFLAGVKAA